MFKTRLLTESGHQGLLTVTYGELSLQYPLAWALFLPNIKKNPFTSLQEVEDPRYSKGRAGLMILIHDPGWNFPSLIEITTQTQSLSLTDCTGVHTRMTSSPRHDSTISSCDRVYRADLLKLHSLRDRNSSDDNHCLRTTIRKFQTHLSAPLKNKNDWENLNVLYHIHYLRKTTGS